jgi:hypothetical protein
MPPGAFSAPSMCREKIINQYIFASLFVIEASRTLAFSVAFISSRCCLSHSLCRALLLVALGTAHAPNHINKFGFPTSKGGEGVWIAAAGMTTRTGQQNFVLAEFVREFVYLEFLHQVTVQKHSTGI